MNINVSLKILDIQLLYGRQLLQIAIRLQAGTNLQAINVKSRLKAKASRLIQMGIFLLMPVVTLQRFKLHLLKSKDDLLLRVPRGSIVGLDCQHISRRQAMEAHHGAGGGILPALADANRHQPGGGFLADR